MYAQVVQGGTTPELRDEMDRIVVEMLIPALEREPGFRGAVNLEDRETGHGMMLTFWETQEEANRIPTTPEFMQGLGAVIRISTGERAPISIWGVNAFVVAEEPAVA